jgi:DNA-directed RNA polymerase specialized sigma24 family protein
MQKLVRRAENLELPMGALFAIAKLRHRLRDAEEAAVMAAREKGASWEDVADALGISRQAIHQRYAARSTAGV